MSSGYMIYRSAFKAVLSFTWGSVSLKKKTPEKKASKQTKNSKQAKQQQQQQKKTIARQMNHQNCYDDKKYKPVQSRSIPTPAA